MLGRLPALFCSLLVWTLVRPLFAQTETGAVVGTVLDASDAAIPHAPVSILNSETGTIIHLTTDDSGSYASPPLRTGSYLISEIGRAHV